MTSAAQRAEAPEETGRKVIAFMSDNHIDPDVAAEVFLLEPSGDDDPRHGYEG
jgi:hypothetical protein